LLPFPGRNLHPVNQADIGDSKNTLDIFDVSFNFGNQVLSGLNSSRIQRGGESAGQSPGYPADDVIERGRIFRAGLVSTVLLFVKVPDSTMNPKMNWYVKPFYVG
jgi:hypothetical protein